MKAKLFVVLLVSLTAIPVFAQIPHANPAAAGVDVLVAERVMFNNGVVNQGNWEPYTSAMGDGTLLFAANTEGLAQDGVTVEEGTERIAVAFFNPDGSVQEVPGFYSSVSPAVPWNSNNDSVRMNGNPPRIAGDKRVGMTKYLIGNECTPWSFPEVFPVWGAGFNYTTTIACCQLLNKTAGGPAPIGPVIDPVYGTATTGEQLDHQRYGGEIRGLSNGNFVSVVEDRQMIYSSSNRAPVVSIISGDTGQVIGTPFNANVFNPDNSTEIWGGLAAFDGGFAVKPEMSSDSDYRIFFFSNTGTPLGSWQAVFRTDPNSPLPDGTQEYTTSVADTGRGDGFRIDSDIRSKYIYYAGRGISSPTGEGSRGVYVTKIDAQTFKTVKEAYVNEGLSTALGGPDRTNVCVDENGNVFVCWADASNTGSRQIAGRFFDADLNPLTDAFLCFTSSESGQGEIVKNLSMQAPSAAMINGRVLVTTRLDSDAGDGSFLSQDQLAIVLKAPIVSSVGNWKKY